MTVKLKVLLLMLGISSTILISSCRKDPDHGNGGGCGDKGCERIGWVDYMPGRCATPPSDEKCIRGEDGTYYRVIADQTGTFASMQIGQKVRFGVKNLKDGEGVYTKPSIAAVIIKEATLICLDPINEGNKNCNVDAEVIGLSYQPNAGPTEEKLLRIGNSHYVVVGEYADDIAAMANGTRLKVGYTLETPCFLTAVVTYPNRDGCITLACVSENGGGVIQH